MKDTSMGKCFICGAVLGKNQMTKHLKSCFKNKSSVNTSGQMTRSLHVLVEGHDNPRYWMHLAVQDNATLEDIDNLLRKVWLECCGHLSAFEIEGERYSTDPLIECDEKGMETVVDDVLDLDVNFSHEYDFGSTTHLVLRVNSILWGNERRKERVWILAKNEAPLINCSSCGGNATIIAARGFLCDKCSRKHKPDWSLPVVNSPRMGVCGYSGSRETA